MKTVNKEAIKLAIEKQRQKGMFKLCIDEKVCPKCSGPLHKKEKTTGWFNIDFVFTCTMSKCDFTHTR